MLSRGEPRFDEELLSLANDAAGLCVADQHPCDEAERPGVLVGIDQPVVHFQEGDLQEEGHNSGPFGRITTGWLRLRAVPSRLPVRYSPRH